MRITSRIIGAAALVAGLGMAAAPALPAQAAPIQNCTLNGSTRSCELWVKAGTTSLPGLSSLAIWGYTDSAAGIPTMPGPLLAANQGETLVITLHNTLPVSTALSIPGIDGDPDFDGAAPNTGVATYSFNVANPGTYIYEAGLTTNGQRQVAMGLFGGLVVRPANPATAYGSADTAFNNEAVVILSEVDPALNNAANPNLFDFWSFTPKYWLMNGKSYPNTDPIPTRPGNTVLVRYINAGLENHSMGVLGAHQRVVAIDGKPLAHPYTVVADTIGAGQTLDVLIKMPPSARANGKFALMNAGVRVDNSSVGPNTAPGASGSPAGGVVNFGGQLTFITIPSDLAAPSACCIALAGTADGSEPVTVTASIDDSLTGSSNVVAAEYYIDSTGTPPPGTGLSMLVQPNTPTAAVTATISAATIRTLAPGAHTLSARGQDAAGNWSALAAGSFNVTLDLVGPALSGASVAPAVSNGSLNLAVHANVSDAGRGDNPITSAEFAVDGGPAIPMTLSPAAAVSAAADAQILSATLPAEGVHTIVISATDQALNVGSGALNFTIDKTGPLATGASASPNPTNQAGTVTLQASLNDALSAIGAAEWYTNVSGTHFPMTATDGLFNSASEAVQASINVSGWPSGAYTLFVRGQDAAGNWSATPAQTTLNVTVADLVGPVVNASPGVVVSPSPANGAQSLSISAVVTDALSTIAAAEWYTNAAGTHTALAAADGSFNSGSEAVTTTINIASWPYGTTTIVVRAKDSVGNWGAPLSKTVVITDLIFANGFEPATGSASPWGWSSASGGGLALTTNAQASLVISGAKSLVGTFGAGNTNAYVQNISPTLESSYHARFYFNPNGSNTVSNTNTAATVWQDIFSAWSNDTGVTGGKLFQVQFNRNATATGYQLRLTNGVSAVLIPTISGTSGKIGIEVVWSNATGAATINVYTAAGTTSRTLPGATSTSARIEMVRLGRSATDNPGVSVVGTQIFDSFESSRYRTVGR